MSEEGSAAPSLKNSPTTITVDLYTMIADFSAMSSDLIADMG
jgi:hypothetical protein